MTPRLAGHRHGECPRRDVTVGQCARNADYLESFSGCFLFGDLADALTESRIPGLGC